MRSKNKKIIKNEKKEKAVEAGIVSQKLSRLWAPILI